MPRKLSPCTTSTSKMARIFPPRFPPDANTPFSPPPHWHFGILTLYSSLLHTKLSSQTNWQLSKKYVYCNIGILPVRKTSFIIAYSVLPVILSSELCDWELHIITYLRAFFMSKKQSLVFAQRFIYLNSCSLSHSLRLWKNRLSALFLRACLNFI